MAGIDGAEGGWCDLLQCNWLVEMAAIGLGDLAGGDWGMGSRGRLNMSARALCRSCNCLVVVLPLSPVMAWWMACP